MAVRLPHHSNYFSKVIYFYRALGRSRISRASFAPPGGGAYSAPALAGRLRANAIRVRRSCCCSRVGAAAAAASSPIRFYNPKTKVSRFRRLCRSRSPNPAWDAALLRLSRIALESGQNFARTKILPKENRYLNRQTSR